MSDRPPLVLGDENPDWPDVCSFGVPTPLCGKPATWHIWWLADSTTSYSCNEHLAYIASRDTSQTPYEVHPFNAPCGEPGTMWLFETDEHVGHCYRGSDDTAEHAASHALKEA